MSLSRRSHGWVAAVAIVLAVWLWPFLAVGQELSIPGQKPLTDVEEIELVYASSHSIPKIIVRGSQPANSFVLSSHPPPMVIPFWFAATIHRHRPLAFSVMDRVDEVAVMSYRTDVDELLAISDDILRYGALEGVPVWLALETTSLLPERHVTLKRERTASLADGTLDLVRRTLTLEAPANRNSPKSTHGGFVSSIRPRYAQSVFRISGAPSVTSNRQSQTCSLEFIIQTFQDS